MQLPCIFAHLRILLRTYARRAANKFVWASIDVTYAGDSTATFGTQWLEKAVYAAATKGRA